MRQMHHMMHGGCMMEHEEKEKQDGEEHEH